VSFSGEFFRAPVFISVKTHTDFSNLDSFPSQTSLDIVILLLFLDFAVSKTNFLQTRKQGWNFLEISPSKTITLCYDSLQIFAPPQNVEDVISHAETAGNI
jgi:hypothetical protein